MQWNEEAIILSSRKFGETSLLLEVFAKSRGLYSGLVRGGQSKKRSATYQPGNIIEATWRGRLEEQLGTFTAEVINAVGCRVIGENLKLISVISITSLLRKTIPDRHGYPQLYEFFNNYLESLCRAGEDWQENYIWLEIALLRYLGFGLDLSCCAVTGGTENLTYLSPRTGRAVTLAAATGYEERLFNLPQFMVNNQPPGTNEIIEALEITEYFMAKNLFIPHQRQLPGERLRFAALLKKSLQNRADTGILREIA